MIFSRNWTKTGSWSKTVPRRCSTGNLWTPKFWKFRFCLTTTNFPHSIALIKEISFRIPSTFQPSHSVFFTAPKNKLTISCQSTSCQIDRSTKYPGRQSWKETIPKVRGWSQLYFSRLSSEQSRDMEDDKGSDLRYWGELSPIFDRRSYF